MTDNNRDGTQEEAARRRAQVIDLRREGKKFREIGDVLGVSTQRAHQLYWEALRDIKFEAVTTYRAAEVEKYDELERVVRGVLEREHVVVSHGRVVRSQDVVLDEEGLPEYDDEGEPKIRLGAPLVDDGPILEAVDRLLKISAARRAVLGLDTPVKQELGVDSSVKYTVVGVDPEAMK